MDLLLSRTLALDDFRYFVPELDHVDEGTDGSLSHERRWEYALALHAMRRRANATEKPSPFVCVVGGPPSFLTLVSSWAPTGSMVPIDPLADLLTEGIRSASEILDPTAEIQDPRVGTQLADMVLCLSLIDRVGDLEHFLYLLSCIVAPGGLLVLTMAFWNHCGAVDTAHHHQLRARIFCPKSYQALRVQLAAHNLTTWGGLDPSFHGHQIHDYTLASLVLEKRA